MASKFLFLQEESAFGPEAIQAMSTAFEQVCEALQLNNDAHAREAVAVRIIDLARRGEHDPERLRQRVLKEASAGA